METQKKTDSHMVDERHHDAEDHVEDADDDGNLHLVAVLEGDLVDCNLEEGMEGE